MEELKPRKRLAAVSIAVVTILGAGAVLVGASTRTPDAAATASLSAATADASLNLPTAAPVPARPVPATAADARTLRTCSVAALAADPRLADFQAQVVNARTGEVLFDRGGDTSSRTASVLKVLTSAAALEVLGPDYRATTTVVAGSTPGSVVLVGGGDLTLTRLPTGMESVYSGAAHIDELARQTLAAWQANPANPPITSLVLDASFFGGPGWEPSWDELERNAGSMPDVTALQVDGDRDDPTRHTSARGIDPIGRAGAAFAAALGGGVSVSLGAAPAGAEQLAVARSQPVSVLIGQALIVSDNALAEMLARLIAVESGAGNTFGALQQSVVAALDTYGIDTTGILIADGSGLSDNNAVPPSYLTRLFVKINDREGDLGVIFDGLPIAGGPTGSLSYSDRFTGENAIADGAVFAKTGWIDTGYTLSGIIRAADGTPLTFAVYALGDVSDNAKQALDTITAGFFRCGDNLSNS
ncbi:D-alanyl-D-alanine carboxypeptidase/D-alanyl-D-alanine-endopeptidase [Cryobacterium sp. TMT3-29-2]|uniref:D-alanyl-D-alanine carboxypeptidase/D-alanyl-D-alanine-endopeptidase n=1 Tax=Cryobacterium sp. TMT3-29-2 TaxID=2555867 RepID=UPI001F544D04|nr:D-alanyl-D-alanine carboxypeptidase [Cryobacterium sp. TMT3-29-2]